MKRFAGALILALCFAAPASADLLPPDDFVQPDPPPALPADPEPAPPPTQTVGACSQSLQGPAWILALVAAGVLTLGAARLLALREDGPQAQPA